MFMYDGIDWTLSAHRSSSSDTYYHSSSKDLVELPLRRMQRIDVLTIQVLVYKEEKT